MNILVLVCSDVWLAGFNRDVFRAKVVGFKCLLRIGTCARRQTAYYILGCVGKL